MDKNGRHLSRKKMLMLKNLRDYKYFNFPNFRNEIKKPKKIVNFMQEKNVHRVKSISINISYYYYY